MDAGHDDGVVVDLVLEDGVLYLELANLADRPALHVTCSFDPPLIDVEGRDVAKLRLFRRVEFLGPRRRIRTLLDSLPGLLARLSRREALRDMHRGLGLLVRLKSERSKIEARQARSDRHAPPSAEPTAAEVSLTHSRRVAAAAAAAPESRNEPPPAPSTGSPMNSRRSKSGWTRS